MLAPNLDPNRWTKTLVQCPGCGWAGNGGQTISEPGNVCRCPKCLKAVEIVTPERPPTYLTK